MRWTMGLLLEAEAEGRRLKYLPFWGHTPPPDGSVGAHVLSQWFEVPFEMDAVRYASAEHAMMAGKARLFGDDATLAKILVAATPGEAKALGREVRGYVDTTWEANRLEIVAAANVAKFGQHPELADYLVGTGDRVLVEASPTDRVWGIGMGQEDPNVERPSRWLGLNLLGFALMEARARLGS